MRWQDVLIHVPDHRRPLTLPELRRLARNGFPEVAARIAAGTCPKCGLNRAGRGHRDLCRRSERPRPVAAAPEPRQPWTPRPSRYAA